VFFGDSRRPSVLEKVGTGRAASLVITLDDPAGAREVLHVAHDRWPDLRIFVRARDMEDARDLMADGICEAVPEMVESSLQLGAEVLRSRGVPEEAIIPLVDNFRDQMYRTIRPRDDAA
jgi:CPA2 family monovalent cation:H+ antiporter-2